MIKEKYIVKFKEALKKENLKLTDQRYLVFKVLLGNDSHLECEDVVRIINKTGKKISRATAYRTLDILVKHELAQKLILDDGIARYENKLFTKHHDHMIDIETNEIIEFVDDEIEKIQTEIAKQHGYEIVKHVHQLFVKKIKK